MVVVYAQQTNPIHLVAQREVQADDDDDDDDQSEHEQEQEQEQEVREIKHLSRTLPFFP